MRFHKRSNDGSGKANAFKTGSKTDEVWGVVFRIDERERPQLDDAEAGYEPTWVDVTDEKGNVYSALLYLAPTSHIDDSLQPYTWYKRFVVEGAKQHRLPETYIAVLERVAAIEDQNQTRHARNIAVMC